ncbi:unnamed protein product [Arabis nemorensis]|uniref:Reverse transcriptase zinc-binding domain-containing protein n=1 Tax=Arabis nemorensis TaxID=586526 RepID=A0A565CKU5_9BRAS|nr:unnamed protein product [Arabis nemorensis]
MERPLDSFSNSSEPGERLVERHIPMDPKCLRCGEIESIAHLLFQCPFAQTVWRMAPLKIPSDTSMGLP